MAETALTFALREEIGNPALFTGRVKELDYFLNWVELVKQELGHSHVILSRKRMGKTALMQRLFNILYTKGDPDVIPFYIRVPEHRMTVGEFANQFFCTQLSQYLAHKTRNSTYVVEVLTREQLKDAFIDDAFILRQVEKMEYYLHREKSPGAAWNHARELGHTIASLKNERIIQFIDEFQFLNAHFYMDDAFQVHNELGSAYQLTGSSKVSPQIIAGSYIGWLSMIVRRMVGRYEEYKLPNLTGEEALASVYNYAGRLGRPVTDESAAYIATICNNDPFYIARMFLSQCPEKDMTTKSGARKVMGYETSPGGGILKMWHEYTSAAFAKVNDMNAKRVVLYLARHADAPRTRDQIREDLKLDISEDVLEERLRKLAGADIISEGNSLYEFRGLGDPIFDIVFRRLYGAEIEKIGQQRIDDEIDGQLKRAKGQLSYYKGLLAEYRVMFAFYQAADRGISLDALVQNAQAGLVLNKPTVAGKRSFHITQDKRVEIDIFLECASGNDFAIEVKDWNTKVSDAHVNAFIEKKALLAGHDRPIGFIFYSEHGFSDKQKAVLEQNDIMFLDGDALSKAVNQA